MTPAAQTVHAECDRLRELITNPDVWSPAEMLAGVERLRAEMLRTLGEQPHPPASAGLLTPKNNERWG